MAYEPRFGLPAAIGRRRSPTVLKPAPCSGTVTESFKIYTSNSLGSSRVVSAVIHDRPRWITMSILMASPNKNENTSYDVVRIESWDEYLSMISDSPYQNWAFRGQRDASAPLFSVLSRYFMSFGVDPRAWPEQEERILRIFKRKAIHFLQHVPD